MQTNIYTAHVTPDGRPYYYNTFTGESLWTLPGDTDTSQVLESIPPSLIEKAVGKQKIEGTDWFIVWTSAYNHFFYNEKTRKSSWMLPNALLSFWNSLAENQKISLVSYQKHPSAQSKRRREDLEKDGENDIDEYINKEEQENDQADINHNEAIIQFASLLSESGINAFSVWENIFPELSSDSRFKAIKDPKERKLLFEQFCKGAAKNYRSSHQQKLEDAQCRFEDFLSNIHHTTTWPDFLQELKAKDWYKILDIKECEQAFKEHLNGLMIAEEQEKETEAIRFNQEFFDLLSEHSVNQNTEWSAIQKMIEKDSRFAAIPSAKARQDLFNYYVDSLSTADATSMASTPSVPHAIFRQLQQAEQRQHRQNFIALVKENSTPFSRWMDVFDKIKDDPRCSAYSTDIKLLQKTFESVYKKQ